jgi:hypothetical protein
MAKELKITDDVRRCDKCGLAMDGDGLCSAHQLQRDHHAGTDPTRDMTGEFFNRLSTKMPTTSRTGSKAATAYHRIFAWSDANERDRTPLSMENAARNLAGIFCPSIVGTASEKKRNSSQSY